METNQTPQAEEQENANKETAPGADEELSMADLLKGEAQVSEKVHSRGVVTVRVVQVTAELVLVDIGEKKEGAIPLADFQDEKTPVTGDEVQAVLQVELVQGVEDGLAVSLGGRRELRDQQGSRDPVLVPHQIRRHTVAQGFLVAVHKPGNPGNPLEPGQRLLVGITGRCGDAGQQPGGHDRIREHSLGTFLRAAVVRCPCCLRGGELPSLTSPPP